MTGKFHLPEGMAGELALVAQSWASENQDSKTLKNANAFFKAVSGEITDADIEGIMRGIRTKCLAAGVPQAVIDAIKAQLDTNSGTRKSLSEMQMEAEKMAIDAVAEAATNGTNTGPETAEEKTLRFVRAVSEHNEKMHGIWGELESEGIHFTEKEKKRLKEIEDEEKELIERLKKNPNDVEAKNRLKVLVKEQTGLENQMLGEAEKQQPNNPQVQQTLKKGKEELENIKNAWNQAGDESSAKALMNQENSYITSISGIDPKATNGKQDGTKLESTHPASASEKKLESKQNSISVDDAVMNASLEDHMDPVVGSLSAPFSNQTVPTPMQPTSRA